MAYSPCSWRTYRDDNAACVSPLTISETRAWFSQNQVHMLYHLEATPTSHILVWYVTWEIRAILLGIQYDSQVTDRTSFLLLYFQFYTFFPCSKLFPLFSQTYNLSSLSMRSNPTTTLFYTHKYHSLGAQTVHDFHVLLRT